MNEVNREDLILKIEEQKKALTTLNNKIKALQENSPVPNKNLL